MCGLSLHAFPLRAATYSIFLNINIATPSPSPSPKHDICVTVLCSRQHEVQFAWVAVALTDVEGILAMQWICPIDNILPTIRGQLQTP